MGGIGIDERRGSIAAHGNVLFGANRQVTEWIAERIPGYVPTKEAVALGVMGKDRLLAGVVYENWNGVHVEACIAAETGSNWASKSTLFSMFYYPFVTLGCDAISVSVPSSNLASLNLATKLGFNPEALIKYAAHDGSTLVVLKMFRTSCKWISRNGKEQK